MSAIFRALKGRWFLTLALSLATLFLSHYLKDPSGNLNSAGIAQKITSWYYSTSGSPVRVVKISHRSERTGGGWYATIYVTVENVSNKVVTDLSGTLKYTAGRPQKATIQYRGKIPPGGREKITLYVQIPRSGGLFGRFKVHFTKIEFQEERNS